MLIIISGVQFYLDTIINAFKRKVVLINLKELCGLAIGFAFLNPAVNFSRGLLVS